VFRWRK